MKRLVFVFCLMTVAGGVMAQTAVAQNSTVQAPNPVAREAAQVVEGNARFTVLTDRLIRMEWSAQGQFEDHATLAIVNRDLPVPVFKVSRTGDGLLIKTKAVMLRYKADGKPFDQGNLQVQFRLNGKTQQWNPGKADTGNLMGTARTLDGCEGPQKINFGDPMEQGILSRDGWALIDESHRPMIL